MIGANAELVGVWSDKLQKHLSHGLHTGVSVGKAKYVFRGRISFQQYLSYPAGQYLGFAGPRSCNYHYRAFDRVNRVALFIIEPVIFLCKLLF